jgi:hypothetical protein
MIVNMKNTFTPSLVVTNENSLPLLQKILILLLTMRNGIGPEVVWPREFEDLILDEEADLTNKLRFLEKYLELVSTMNSEIYKFGAIYVFKMFLEN